MIDSLASVFEIGPGNVGLSFYTGTLFRGQPAFKDISDRALKCVSYAFGRKLHS